jgi:guanylate kinase
MLLVDDGVLSYSVSVTTRPPRRGETDGVHYEFVGDEEFDRLVESGVLAEWAVVHGFRYGTRKSSIRDLTSAGQDVVMDVDVQGGMSIREAFPEALLIFVVPPSSKELELRLRARATDATDVIETRLENAREELKWSGRYDHVVVNDDLERAAAEVRDIIVREREGRARTPDQENQAKKPGLE